MKTKKTTLIFLLGFCASEVSASTIFLSDFSGSGASFLENVITDSAGVKYSTAVPAPAGTNPGPALIRVGYFTSLAPTVIAKLSSPDKDTVYAEINSSNFVELGTGGNFGTPRATGLPRLTTRTINGIANTTGRLTGSIETVKPGAGGIPSGTQLFLLIYNATTTGAATELGIFSSDDATWKMPSDDLADATLNTVFVNTPGEVYRGSLGSLRLAPLIPEPSTSILAFGAGALALRRRRSK